MSKSQQLILTCSTDLDKLSMKYNRLHYLKKRILNPSFMQSIEWVRVDVTVHFLRE